MFSSEPLFAPEPVSPIIGHNIWSHNPVKDTLDYSDVGLLQESVIVDKNTKGRFLYKSYDIASKLSPGGVWNVEIIDDKNVLFRRANNAVDIRPSKQLDGIVCMILFLHTFYPTFLSWFLMAVGWSSYMCQNDPDNINVVASWSSLLSQVYRVLDCVGEHFVDYIEHVEQRSMLCGLGTFNGINMNNTDINAANYDEEEEVDEDYESSDEEVVEEYDKKSADYDDEHSTGSTHSSMPSLQSDDGGTGDPHVRGLEFQMNDEALAALIDEYYEVVHKFHTSDTEFVKWVRNVNEFVDADYFGESDESDENWLYALTSECVTRDVKFEEVVGAFLLYTDDKTPSEDDDDWEKDIGTGDTIKPLRTGRWLRSRR